VAGLYYILSSGRTAKRSIRHPGGSAASRKPEDEA
jgi:hypothetical protein